MLQADIVERLYVETHLVTITTEVLTAKLLALEEQRRLREKARWKALEQDLVNHNNNEEKFVAPIMPGDEAAIAKFHSEDTNLQALSPITPPNPIQYRRPVESLISVRLKSGQLLKTSSQVLEALRAHTREVESTQSDNVFVMKQLLPFTDRLGNAIRFLNDIPHHPNGLQKTPQKKTTSPLNGLNRSSHGKFKKTLKVRAALDKSTVAWTSTVRLKPKTSLLQQLDDMAADWTVPNTSSQDTSDITLNPKIPTVGKPSSVLQGKTSLVPLIKKWKSSSNHTKMLPLSTALQRIANGTLDSDKLVNGINGLHQNGVS